MERHHHDLQNVYKTFTCQWDEEGYTKYIGGREARMSLRLPGSFLTVQIIGG